MSSSSWPLLFWSSLLRFLYYFPLSEAVSDHERAWFVWLWVAFFDKALVNMLAIYNRQEENGVITVPLATFPWSKWYSISTCYIWAWKTRFAVNTMHLNCCKKEYKDVRKTSMWWSREEIQVNSDATIATEWYLASALDLVTVSYFLVLKRCSWIR